jgi:mannose-6-phosphate isomerase
MQKAYKLHGVHKHYDWGGTQFIPQLMQVPNIVNQPYAEYWMGAHSSAPSIIQTQEGDSSILNFLDKEELPYLFKILDVAKMLSIQVHPTIENAIKGFEEEQAKGIAINASNRNYKDKNHKPEVMVALSDFWLLHGFLAPDILTKRLQENVYFNSLLDYFNGADYLGLYSHFMQLSSQESDRILKPLMMDAVSSVDKGEVNKSHPHWWAHKYYQGIVPNENIDKGIFSIYILNIVQVAKHEGVFQGAGLLHAYLEGQNIELMANSDNVLRGGLTTKHVDVDELINHVKFEPTYPNVLKGDILNDFETNYPCPVKDFGLSKIAIKQGETYTINTASLEMLLCMEGNIELDTFFITAGEVAMVKANQSIELKANRDSILFRSFVP